MGLKGLCINLAKLLTGNITCAFTACGGLLCPCTLTPTQQGIFDVIYPVTIVLIIVGCIAAVGCILMCVLTIVTKVRKPYDQVITAINTRVQTEYYKLMIDRETDISSIPFESGANLYQIVERMRKNTKKGWDIYAAELGNDPFKCMAVLLWLIASQEGIAMISAQSIFDMYVHDVNADMVNKTDSFRIGKEGIQRMTGRNLVVNGKPGNHNTYVYSSDDKTFYAFSVVAVCPYLEIRQDGIKGDCLLINQLVDWNVDIEKYPLVSFDTHPYLADYYERSIRYKESREPITTQGFCCTTTVIDPIDYEEEFELVETFNNESLGNYVRAIVEKIQRAHAANDTSNFTHNTMLSNLDPLDYAYCRKLTIHLEDVYSNAELTRPLPASDVINRFKEIVFIYVNPNYESFSNSFVIEMKEEVKKTTMLLF